jgi:hypothetical protein
MQHEGLTRYQHLDLAFRTVSQINYCLSIAPSVAFLLQQQIISEAQGYFRTRGFLSLFLFFVVPVFDTWSCCFSGWPSTAGLL